MSNSSNVPISTDLVIAYAMDGNKATLFGHPIVEGVALETVLDRLDGSERTERIPVDLVHSHFSTAGHFPACLGRIGDRDLYLFRINGFDRDRYHILVEGDRLAERPIPIPRTE